MTGPTIKSVTRKAVRNKLVPFFKKAMEDDSFRLRKENLNTLKFWVKSMDGQDLDALKTLSIDVMREMERRVRVTRDLIESELFFREEADGG